MSDVSVRAFLLTVSTKGDISEECLTKLVKWMSKSTVHAYAVTENGESGKLHFHAALVFKTPQNKPHLANQLFTRYVKPFHPDSVGKVAIKLVAMPGHKWYDDYLRKESGVQVLYDTYDRDAVDSYLPTQAEQEVLVSRSGKPQLNAWWDKHVEGWKASEFTDDAPGAIYYLTDCMHKNIIQVMRDDRVLTDTAYALWKRRHGILTPSAHQLLLLQRKDMTYTFSCHDTRGAAPPSI